MMPVSSYYDHRIVLDTETSHLEGWELVDDLLATFIVDVSKDQAVRRYLFHPVLFLSKP